MKIEKLSYYPYEIPFTTGLIRSGVLLYVTGEAGKNGWGEVAPLPNWSKESLEESLGELREREEEILGIDWTPHTCFDELHKLALLPSCSFGMESALLSILMPLSGYSVRTSALFTGTPSQILLHAEQRKKEGYTSAKLKVSNLDFKETREVIVRLKDVFRLRIDVNRAWNTEDSLRFFSEFPLDTFDYVEEPFLNPHDLAAFPHPLAVDESFPGDLSLQQVESFPTLKALIYKPTVQGGMLHCIPLHRRAVKRGVSIVLSSAFESDVGLANIDSMAHRLSLSSPVGTGTRHYFKRDHAAN